jgi:hypothetical protein
MDIYNYIERMSDYIELKNWNGLESHFKTIAQSLAGEEIASDISEVNLSNYQKQLCADLTLAIEKARNLNAKAIYFEYDLDNDWQSHFFVCQNYNLPTEGDDEWACDWLDEFESTDSPSFGDLYIPGFDSTEIAKGASLYLIARTVAAFGRCCEKYVTESFAICLAFHDQDPVMRIYEPLT